LCFRDVKQMKILILRAKPRVKENTKSIWVYRQKDVLETDADNRKFIRLRLKCDGTRAETRFRLSAKWTSPLKSAGASIQSTIGSRGVLISGSNARYTMFRGSVKSTGYPLHSPVSPSLPLLASPCAITFQLDSTTTYEETAANNGQGETVYGFFENMLIS
jgi:hypothetical protein